MKMRVYRIIMSIIHAPADICRASITVEAVFVMALILAVLMWIMEAAIGMYRQVAEAAEWNWLDIRDAARDFRLIYFRKEWLP